MELKRRNLIAYGLLAAGWVLVVAWQTQEHARVREYAKNNLRNRSRDIATTMTSFIQGLQFRGAVFSERLQPVLTNLVSLGTTELPGSGEVLSVVLLNAEGTPVAKAGNDINLEQEDLRRARERWGRRSLLIAFPIPGVSVAQEGATNPIAPFIVNLPTNNLRGPFPRRGEPPRPPPPDGSNSVARADFGAPPGPGPDGPPPPGPPERGPRDGRPRGGRLGWLFDPSQLDPRREMHGLVLAMSLDNFQAICQHDLRLRFVIGFFATIAALGSGLAWRNLATSSELQIRLVRASELNTHLRQMNLAAAGLAHETRNPLNIIRGLAQMMARLPGGAPEVQKRASEIIDEADKVAAQLNEFINYSRPRELRRSRLSLGPAINEVVRALSYDLEAKNVQLQITGEPLHIQADEQLFRQALFNLLLNAVQAVDPGGAIHIHVARRNGAEAVLDIADNGPGVPPERRDEIFKPYFTTQKKGTGLGLAIVQQIVLAHGWEVECLPNNPKGALFRISHLKLAA